MTFCVFQDVHGFYVCCHASVLQREKNKGHSSSGEHGTGGRDVKEPLHCIMNPGFHFSYVILSPFSKQVMYTDSPIVTSAPTGSGKTVIFELAIIRLLMQSATDVPIGKIIYGEYIIMRIVLCFFFNHRKI